MTYGLQVLVNNGGWLLVFVIVLVIGAVVFFRMLNQTIGEDHMERIQQLQTEQTFARIHLLAEDYQLDSKDRQHGSNRPG